MEVPYWFVYFLWGFAAVIMAVVIGFGIYLIGCVVWHRSQYWANRQNKIDADNQNRLQKKLEVNYEAYTNALQELVPANHRLANGELKSIVPDVLTDEEEYP